MDRNKKLALFSLLALRGGFPQEKIKEYLDRAAQAGGDLGQQVGDSFTNLQGMASNILSQAGPITQAFGNFNPALYRGINQSMTNTGVDIGVPEGTEVAVPQGEWEVEETGTGYNRGYGNSILVRNRQTGEKLRFSHLSKLGVRKGETLKGGRKIGLTGATGNVTGPHLDLEYYDKAGRVADFLRSQYNRNL